MHAVHVCPFLITFITDCMAFINAMGEHPTVNIQTYKMEHKCHSM